MNPNIRKLLGLGLLLSLICGPAFAQLLVSGATAFGPISMTAQIAKLGDGCPVHGTIPIPAGAIIDVDDICQPSKWRTAAASQSSCSGRSTSVLRVNFKRQENMILVEQIALAQKQIHMRLFGTLEDAHGELRDVASIQRLELCTESLPSATQPLLPDGFCREPRQFAVAFDYETPLNNKILTNGFSFYVRVSGNPPNGFDVEKASEDVLASFRRAITIWTAALQDNDALLTPATRAFIRARTSTSSGGFVLLTPPQVIRLGCPHTAVFIVELNFGGDTTFPADSVFLTLAKARVEGRTIALNMRDVSCFKTMPKYDAGRLLLRDDECVNLLPILTHELGHAFGLAHIPNADGWALMNPVLSDNATVPTKTDVSALVSALDRSITGARPGELEFREASGLRAPSDWKAVRK